jgi:hypothetical protein
LTRAPARTRHRYESVRSHVKSCGRSRGGAARRSGIVIRPRSAVPRRGTHFTALRTLPQTGNPYASAGPGSYESHAPVGDEPPHVSKRFAPFWRVAAVDSTSSTLSIYLKGFRSGASSCEIVRSRPRTTTLSACTRWRTQTRIGAGRAPSRAFGSRAVRPSDTLRHPISMAS